MYTEKLLEEFYNPINVGVIKGADAVGKVKDKLCGDIVKFYIAVEKDTIVDVKFQAYGSVVSIAASSVATKLIMNKTFDEVYTITIDQLKSELGGKVPSSKNYALLLVEDAIHTAINNYFLKTLGYVPDKFKISNIANSDELDQDDDEDEVKTESKKENKEKVQKQPKKVEQKTESASNNLKTEQKTANPKQDTKEVNKKAEDKKEVAEVSQQKEVVQSSPTPQISKTTTKTVEVYTRDIDDIDEEDKIFDSIDDLTSTLSDALKKLNEENADD